MGDWCNNGLDCSIALGHRKDDGARAFLLTLICPGLVFVTPEILEVNDEAGFGSG